MPVQKLLGTLVVVLGILAFGCNDNRPDADNSVKADSSVKVDGPVEDDTEPGSCELHNTPYAVEIIPVHYGKPARPQYTEEQWKWKEKERAAWDRSFRYSHVANKAGGCVEREAKFAKVSYCPKCRKADEEWHAKHGTVEHPKNPD
jgi:hypothetical protein